MNTMRKVPASKRRSGVLGLNEKRTTAEALDQLTLVPDPHRGGQTIGIRGEAAEGSQEQEPLEHAAQSERTQPAPARAMLRNRIIGMAAGASTTEQQEHKDQLEALQRQIASGDAIVELDTDAIDDSPFKDRIEISDAETKVLAEQIEQEGQLVPVLVRPHPSAPGRHQLAYGHRRVRAARMLGRRVRAVVRTMSDAELVVAQGQENNARQDLSFIEKALFGATLESAGIDRKQIMSALSTDPTNLSKMISIANKVSREIIEGIGKAPKIGAPRWLQLQSLLEKTPDGAVTAREHIASAAFQKEQDSNKRFVSLLTKLTESDTNKGPVPNYWSSPRGGQVAKHWETAGHVTVQIDKTKDREFAEFVNNKISDLLTELYRDFEASRPTAS